MSGLRLHKRTGISPPAMARTPLIFGAIAPEGARSTGTGSGGARVDAYGPGHRACHTGAVHIAGKRPRRARGLPQAMGARADVGVMASAPSARIGAVAYVAARRERIRKAHQRDAKREPPAAHGGDALPRDASRCRLLPSGGNIIRHFADTLPPGTPIRIEFIGDGARSRCLTPHANAPATRQAAQRRPRDTGSASIAVTLATTGRS